MPPYVVRRVEEILEQERVWQLLPEAPTLRVRVEAVLEAGLSLPAAHATWNSEYLARLPGLEPLRQQERGAVTPRGLVRVVCECVDRPSGGMSSYFGFRGQFVSLLVSVPEGCVWDVRIDEAT